ncbi:hypothetical protein MKW94_028541, partial [Papaver nudicaule]|nr:hypothetical protein [Papaver nudicaule]
MRGGTVQISWHDTKPVLTLDFHLKSGLLATGGANLSCLGLKMPALALVTIVDLMAVGGAVQTGA